MKERTLIRRASEYSTSGSVFNQWVFGISLTGFLACVTVAQALDSQLILVGGYFCFGLLAIQTGIVVSRRGIALPLEVTLYWAFVVWSVVTGLFIHIEPVSFWTGVERLIQVGALLTLIVVYTSAVRSLEPVLVPVLALALVLVGYGFVSGDFQLATEIRERGDRVVGTRATSLTSNANSLGMICVYGLGGCALLWRLARGLSFRILLAVLVMLLLMGITLSASRKAFVMVFLFLASWGWFCYRQVFLRNLSTIIGVGIVVVVALVSGRYALQGTMLGYRLGLTVSSDDLDTGTGGRTALFREGVEIFATSPFAGVGFAQFKANSIYELYSHSEYMEVLTGTGLFGALLYFGVYVVAWRRLRFVYAFCADDGMRYSSGLCLALSICYAVVGVVLVHYSSFVSMALLASLIGFGFGAQRQVLHQRASRRGDLGVERTRRGQMAKAQEQHRGGDALHGVPRHESRPLGLRR